MTWAEVEGCREPADLVFTLDDLPARLDTHGDLMHPLIDTEGFRLPRGGVIGRVPG